MMEDTNEYTDSYVRETEGMFRQLLNPMEPLIMKIQSLLVWENPRKSALVFLVVHGIFWFVAVHGLQFYFIISSIAMVLFFIHTWKKWIWPEIRVPPPVPDDPDSWTPVHLRLMSVPEICQHLAQFWIFMSNNFNCWLAFRRDHHFLFCCLNCSFLVMFAALGRIVSGLTLTYIIVMSLMLWPCFLYNNLLQKIYLSIEPVFMKLDYTLKIKPWIWKSKESRKSASFGSIGSPTRDSDSESEELMPTQDPKVTAALAKAITDSEDEGGSPDIPTPVMSKEPSVEREEDRDSLSDNSDIESEFAKGLGQMPSIEDNLTDDEILEPSIPSTTQSKHTGKEDIKFVSSHFGDSSDEDDTSIVQGLNFPDIKDLSMTDSSKGIDSSQGLAQIANRIVTNTISSVMTSAVSGISSQSQVKTSASNREKRTAYTADEFDGRTDNENLGQRSLGRQLSSDASDVDIAEEFEFLDEYDIQDKEQ